MSECDKILEHGIFDGIQISTSKSAAETYTEWLKSATYQEIQNAQNQGLQIGFPIDGVPFQLGASASQNDYNAWRQAIDTGRTRTITDQEMVTIAQQSVDRGIVSAWKDCVLNTAFGLLDYEDIADDGTFTVLFRYAPNAPEDRPPTITGFVVTNANLQ